MDSLLYSEIRDKLRRRDLDHSAWRDSINDFLSDVEARIRDLAGQEQDLEVCTWGYLDGQGNFVRHQFEDISLGFNFALKIYFYKQGKNSVLREEVFDFEVKCKDGYWRFELEDKLFTIPKDELYDKPQIDEIARFVGVELKNRIFPQWNPEDE
jgi:hypothetical protein